MFNFVQSVLSVKLKLEFPIKITTINSDSNYRQHVAHQTRTSYVPRFTNRHKKFYGSWNIVRIGYVYLVEDSLRLLSSIRPY